MNLSSRQYQQGSYVGLNWFLIQRSFFLLLIAACGDNRAPFDVADGEAEIVAAAMSSIRA